MKARAAAGLPRFAVQGLNTKVPLDHPYVAKADTDDAKGDDLPNSYTNGPYLPNAVPRAVLLEMQQLWVRLGVITALINYPQMASALAMPTADLPAAHAGLVNDIRRVEGELKVLLSQIMRAGSYESVIRNSTNDRLISAVLAVVVAMRFLRRMDATRSYFVQLEVGEPDASRDLFVALPPAKTALLSGIVIAFIQEQADGSLLRQYWQAPY